MPVSTTERMTFLAEIMPVQELHVCESQLFSAIRSHMRALFTSVYLPDGDVRQNEPALVLRIEMMKWLTSPLMPDFGLLQRCGLADETSTRLRWGEDVAREVAVLKELISCYCEEGSVLNAEFVRVFSDLTSEFGQDRIKIWCHRNECDLFRELFEELSELDDQVFICSLGDYRSCSPADALIRFGPLRTRGMTRTPEALITAPAYRRLVRFVWQGLADEEGFADDPVIPAHNYLAIMRSERRTVSGNSSTVPFQLAVGPTDDLAFFAETMAPARGSHRGVLVEFPDDYGVLLRPGSGLLVFSPRLNDTDAIDYRQISDVEEGDYLLIHDADADLGEVSVDAAKMPLAVVWKRALADTYRQQPSLCVQKMKDAGITLLDLHRAIQSWMDMNGTVIHAPQNRKHFQALLTRVLDPGLIPPRSESGEMVSGWRLAWAEVAASRVTAIQHGVLESAIVNEQLVAELRKEIGHLRDLVSTAAEYQHMLLPERGLIGSVEFHPVISISSGFAAPPEEFGKPMKLLAAEQYRGEPGDDSQCA